jgi:sulfonate transport system substrate-binding protein
MDAPIAKDPFIVRIGTSGLAVDYGPLYIAKHNHWLDEVLKPYGAACKYEVYESISAIIDAHASEQIDCMFEADARAIVVAAAGIDGKILSISCSLTQEILVHKDSGISTTSDLRDKTIAVHIGGSSHYGLLKILQKSGLSKENVHILNMTTDEGKTAFTSKQVDAWAIWPPFVEEAELAGIGTTLGGGTVQLHSIMVARNRFLSENRSLCQAMVDVLDRAKRWILEHPVDSQKIIAQEFNMPLKVVERAFPRHNWKAQLDNAVLQDIQAKADFLKAVGSIQTPVNVRTSMLDSTLAASPRFESHSMPGQVGSGQNP